MAFSPYFALFLQRGLSNLIPENSDLKAIEYGPPGWVLGQHVDENGALKNYALQLSVHDVFASAGPQWRSITMTLRILLKVEASMRLSAGLRNSKHFSSTDHCPLSLYALPLYVSSLVS